MLRALTLRVRGRSAAARPMLTAPPPSIVNKRQQTSTSGAELCIGARKLLQNLSICQHRSGLGAPRHASRAWPTRLHRSAGGDDVNMRQHRHAMPRPGRVRPHDRAPSTRSAATTCRRSRYTCPNSRARRTHVSAPPARPKTGHTFNLVQNKNNIKRENSQPGTRASRPFRQGARPPRDPARGRAPAETTRRFPPDEAVMMTCRPAPGETQL